MPDLDVTPIGPACTLGEGPLWHPERGTLFWFDIPHGQLFEAAADGTMLATRAFSEPASAAGWIDRDTLLVATASGLTRLDLETDERTVVTEMEADDPVTRSNDGRVGPDGAFWIGTMGRALEPRAGSYYRYAKGRLHTLFEEVSVPNATCFSPDGAWAYLADTRRQLIWRWRLESGAPVGEREVHIDLKGTDANPDGAVCDAEGCLWNAHWGTGRLVRYDPAGREMDRIALPVSQPTCPAFGGPDLRTLFVTSAAEGLGGAKNPAEPLAGRTLAFPAPVTGLPENRVLI